jgi:hypothetical protein
MSEPVLTFDEAAHRYTMDGNVVPGVTSIIGAVLGTGFEFMAPADAEWAKARGHAVHACAAMIARGIAFDTPAGIEGQVAALRAFMAAFKPTVRHVEHMVYSTTFRYAGTLDLASDEGILFDYKGSMDEERARLQLAGYAVALSEMGDRRKWSGIAVEVRDDGTYKIGGMWKLDNWRGEWLAVRAVYGIKERMGQIK